MTIQSKRPCSIYYMLDDAFFKNAELHLPEVKFVVTIRPDKEVLA